MSGDLSSGATGPGADPVHWLRLLLSLAFIVTLPLLVISTNLRALVTDRDLLLDGFRDNQVALTTGLDDRQLSAVADVFVAYFQAPPGRLDVDVTVNGVQRPLFNEREIQHMEDVQALVQWFLRAQVVAAGIVVVRLLVALFLERSPHFLGLDMLWSTGLVLTLVALIGILAAVDFTALWTRFHQVAFRNDLWLLDPRTDYLIMLFPEPFWYTATLRMAGGVGLSMLAIGAVGFLTWRFGPPAR